MAGTHFTVCGQDVFVSETYVWYNSLRLSFKKAADAAKEKYMQKYKAYKNIEDFIENGYDDGQKMDYCQ